MFTDLVVLPVESVPFIVGALQSVSYCNGGGNRGIAGWDISGEIMWGGPPRII